MILMEKHKKQYSERSFFKAGQIFQHTIEHREDIKINYGLSLDYDTFEVIDILGQHTDREIVLIPLPYGFNICLTNHEPDRKKSQWRNE